MKYRVEVREIQSTIVEVEAKDKKDAIEVIKDKYYGNNVDTSNAKYVDTVFSIVK